MHDKLNLLHNYMKEVKQATKEEELFQLRDSYKERLGISSEDDILYKLIRDGQSFGKELIALKASGIDISRAKKLAALTKEEKAELAEVEAIIDENRFNYHFQPIVNTSDGSIYSYEALMRPQSDMKMNPFLVLKYAEMTGRLGDIERATFLNVLNIIDSNKETFRGRRVFINSIPKTRLNNSDLRRVGELLIKHSNTAVVELTEYAENDEDELNNIKERYMNMGVKIAIDDYGTGYSNVKNLLRYMPNYVKIDRSLITEIQNNPKQRHFVREIIEFCHSTNIMALAEGVETAEELRTVILLGADLIQGYYTAKPNSDIIDEIPYEIRDEIRIYQQERQDGKDQQVYVADHGERILLDKLVKDEYQCIFAMKSDSENNEINVVGSPSLDTEIHIETVKNFNGTIVLENAHLSNIKDRPCINIGENCDITLVLKGDNKLNKGGIRVPKSSRLTVSGDGVLNITLDGAEYFGIGNDISSSHGDLVFNQTGVLNITARGRSGVCIGSGMGGNIKIEQGKFIFNPSGRAGVVIGALYGDFSLSICNCSIDADVAFMKGVGIGSLTGSTNVTLNRASVKIYICGEELAGIGTLSGESARLHQSDAILQISVRAANGSAIGSLTESTYYKIENAAFRAEVGGENSLPFGGLNGDTEVEFINADATVKMDTKVDISKYITTDIIKITGGRTNFTNFGEEINLT